MKPGFAPAIRPLLVAALSVGAFAVLPSIASAADAAGNVAAGKKVFSVRCAGCHKADASGGIKMGDETSPDLRAPGLEAMYNNDDKLIARAILDGKDEDGGPMDEIMPRWRGKLTTTEVSDIIAYLKTLHK